MKRAATAIAAATFLLPTLAFAQATTTTKEDVAETTARVEQKISIDHATGDATKGEHKAARESADKAADAAHQEKVEAIEKP